MQNNKSSFIGYLGQDIDVFQMPSGDQVGTARLAVTKKWKKDGELQEKTTWITLKFSDFKKSVFPYLKKGTKIAVDCEYSPREYQDKDGKNRIAPEFFVSSITLMGGINKTTNQNEVTDHSDEVDDLPF